MPKLSISVKEFEIRRQIKINSRILIIGKPDTGKCLAPGTLILTYDGTLQKVETLKSRDRLMGDDGTVRNIIAIVKGTDLMYKVNQSNGISYTVTSDHILSLRTAENTIRDIAVKKYLELSDREKKTLSGYRIAPFEIKEQLSPRSAFQSQVNKLKNRLPFSPLSYVSSELTIKFLGTGEYYGFVLDGNCRFLLEDMTVTHNSCIAQDIMYNFCDRCPVAQIFSGSESSNQAYAKIVNPVYIFEGYDVDGLESGIYRQNLCKNTGCENTGCVFVIDDCMDDDAMFSKKPFTTIVKNGRHFGDALYIVLAQWCKDLKPKNRSLIDYIFLTKEDSRATRKRLFDEYANFIPDMTVGKKKFKALDIFNKLMDELTEDFTAMVIVNRGTESSKMEHKLFWYKAKHRPNGFAFGCDEYKNWGEERLNIEKCYMIKKPSKQDKDKKKGRFSRVV